MRATAGAAIAIILTGCFEDIDLPRSRASNGEVGTLSPLHEASDCTEVLATIRAQYIRQMEEAVEANLRSVLEGDYCRDYGDYADSYVDVCSDSGGWTEEGDVPEDEASEYSETNNQVAGVDESDFIKNDGGYIYILADGRFQIIDAWPPEESRAIGSFDIEGEPRSMFVHEDRAVIYSSLSPYDTGYYDPYHGPGWCTYGYDCDFTGDGMPLKITVLDISDRVHPALVRETLFSGSYINSRRIGTAVYTVVNFPEISFPSVRYWPTDLPTNCPSTAIEKMQVLASFRNLEQANRLTINRTPAADWIPNITDTIHTGSGSVTTEGLLESCDGFLVSGMTDGHTLLTIAAIDMTALDPIATTTIVGRPGAVYASSDSLYVGTRHYSGDGFYSDAPDEFTTIHKFVLDHEVPDSTYSATGVVEGRVLNQFSMDEHDGRLRIATTTGRLPDTATHSTLSVLEQTASGLEVVGRIDDIAPSEDIRSVRFDGDRGFIVTFKKTDPLFAMDLSDPAHPVIDGELKIPGFSTYMHFLDETHLLTIGYDADDMGEFAWFQGIQLQILDVTDLESPELVHKEVIGTRGSTSDAATDHLAFNFFPPLDALAIPMVICEGGSGGTYGDTMTFSGLLVYRVTLEAGFEKLGGVSHHDPLSGVSCGNWWTSSNSPVERSVFMEHFVYSVDPTLIKVEDIDALGTDLAVVDLSE